MTDEAKIDYLFKWRCMLELTTVDFADKLAVAIHHITEIFGRTNIIYRLEEVLHDFKQINPYITESELQIKRDHFIKLAIGWVDSEIRDLELQCDRKYSPIIGKPTHIRQRAIYYLKRYYRILWSDKSIQLKPWLEVVIDLTTQLKEISGVTPYIFIHLKNKFDESLNIYDSKKVTAIRDEVIYESLNELKRINDIIHEATKDEIPEPKVYTHRPQRGTILTEQVYKDNSNQQEDLENSSDSTSLQEVLKVEEKNPEKKNSIIYNPWVSGVGTKLLADLIKWIVILFVGSIGVSGILKYLTQEIKISIWQLGLIIFFVGLIIFLVKKALSKKTQP